MLRYCISGPVNKALHHRLLRDLLKGAVSLFYCVLHAKATTCNQHAKNGDERLQAQHDCDTLHWLRHVLMSCDVESSVCSQATPTHQTYPNVRLLYASCVSFWAHLPFNHCQMSPDTCRPHAFLSTWSVCRLQLTDHHCCPSLAHLLCLQAHRL